MALPKINELPKYPLTIPSTNKQVFFRPFLVKEQKVMLMAMESRDERQMLKAVSDVVDACIIDPIDVNRLATFDVEYIFTQIRSKSVGEKAELSIKCNKCDVANQVEVPLDQINVTQSKQSNEIKLNDFYTIVMKYPSYGDITRMERKRKTLTSTIYETVLMSLDKLKTNDEVLSFADESEEDINTFLESLTSDQFDALMTFVNSAPVITCDIEFKCTGCGTNNKHTLRGITDFFT